jgi:Lipid A 3-O-deacylase (PagL)
VLPSKSHVAEFCRAARAFAVIPFIFLAWASVAKAQNPTVDPVYARVNTFGFFAAYSNDSSHILLGDAVNRKLLNLGLSYDRRLMLRRNVIWQYEAELIPIAIESDPVEIVDYTVTWTNPPGVAHGSDPETFTGPCIPASGTVNIPGVETDTYAGTCRRRWTIGEAMTPFGLRWNYRPRSRLQPFLDGHGGFMYSTQPIPLLDAGSFNFLFDIGAGFEWYRSKTHSIRLEYRYHHISNDNTAPTNPGIDNGLFQVTWAFGR